MDIVFMGSPDFAVPSLEVLAKNPVINVKAVITQPDRKRGRGQKLQPTPVKEQAHLLRLNVLSERDVNHSQFLDLLQGMAADVIVVVAFGQKLGTRLLSIAKYGCINLHASLLPEYRGASPIHQALIDGREFTGLTTIYMDQGWDTGDMIYQETVPIAKSDTFASLHDKLAVIGGKLLEKTLLAVEEGRAPRIEQEEERATYAYKIDKNKGLINWEQGAAELANLVRGVNPWPGAFTYMHGQLVKIWKVTPCAKNSAGQAVPGEVVSAKQEDGLIVQTGKGQLRIDQLQLTGRKSLTSREFLRGYQLKTGDRFKDNNE
ncbi:MAG: methionyl-tRNA formyltransferase [Halanaerobiales bacterium]|nr:methionyl-tRNA formyltransferase [Halanaerobiales bacterium]